MRAPACASNVRSTCPRTRSASSSSPRRRAGTPRSRPSGPTSAPFASSKQSLPERRTPHESKKDEIRRRCAAMLALVAVLALGPGGASAAPGDNAVVHWSEVAANAIVVGRAPASSSVLGGMVHGAMYDAVASIEGGLEPFATSVTAPPDASVDAAVAQAARDVLVARVPAQTATIQLAYDAYMASIPRRARKGRWQGGGNRRRGRDAGDADRRPLRRRRSVRPASVRTGRLRADRDHSRGHPRPRARAAVHTRLALRVPAQWPDRNDEPTLRPGPGRGAVDRTCQQHRSNAVPDRDRSLPLGADVLPVQSHPAQPGECTRPRPARVGAAARLRERRDRGHDARLLGCEVPLHVLAAQPRDWAGRHRREPGYLARGGLAAVHRRQPPGVSLRPCVLHRCRDRVAPELLRDEAREAPVFSAVTQTTRTYENLDDLVADVGNARVWGGLHYRWTTEKSSKHFPRIARDVGKEHFLARRGHDHDD